MSDCVYINWSASISIIVQGRIIVAWTGTSRLRQRAREGDKLTSRITHMFLNPLCTFLSYISNRSRDALNEWFTLFQESSGLICYRIKEGELLLLGVLLEWRCGNCYAGYESSHYGCCAGVAHLAWVDCGVIEGWREDKRRQVSMWHDGRNNRRKAQGRAVEEDWSDGWCLSLLPSLNTYQLPGPDKLLYLEDVRMSRQAATPPAATNKAYHIMAPCMHCWTAVQHRFDRKNRKQSSKQSGASVQTSKIGKL